MASLEDAGYDRARSYEPIYDPMGDNRREDIVGCRITATDENGTRATEAIFYPDNWYLHERTKWNEPK